jgi:uncharacterized membrane-anchored protein
MKTFLRKIFVLVAGLVVGAVAWFITGLFGLMISGMAGMYGFGVVALDALVVALLTWIVLRRRGLNYFTIGMLSFFVGMLLIPGPCSIYSLV